jgi:hypothetical protein
MADTDEERLRRKTALETVMMMLVRAGCLLSAYELIKPEVVDKVHGFFWQGIRDGRHLYDEVVVTCTTR